MSSKLIINHKEKRVEVEQVKLPVDEEETRRPAGARAAPRLESLLTAPLHFVLNGA